MSEIDRRLLLGTVGLAGVAALAARGKGGPLNPPAGPVAPTGRTLEEVYDRVVEPGQAGGLTLLPNAATLISASNGSYAVSSSRLGSGPLLTISGDHVTLDLQGQSFVSTTFIAPALTVSGVRTRVTIRNGTIVGGNTGVQASSAVTALTLENLTFVGQRTAAVNVASSGSRSCRIENCHAINTGAGTGASEGNLSITAFLMSGGLHTVRNCTASGFAYNGVGAPIFRGYYFNTSVANGGTGNTLDRCSVVADNSPPGVSAGIQFAGSCIYRDNTVSGFPITSYAFGAARVDAGGNV